MRSFNIKKYIELIAVALIIFVGFDSYCIGTDWTWSRRYGGGDSENLHSVQQTNDGGYIIAGDTNTGLDGISDYLIIKLSASGAIEWQKIYGAGNESPSCIIQTNDGGYIVAGGSGSFGYRAWIIKINSSGDIIWQKAYGGINLDGDIIDSIQQASDGGYIAAGETYSFGAGDADIWILKLDSFGNIQWQKTYGSALEDGAGSIQKTNDGGYIVAGASRSFGSGDPDIWALKLDSSGGIEWQKTYGIAGISEATESISQTNDGGYIVSAFTYNYFWIIKLDASGTIVWQKSYRDMDGADSYDVQPTSDGGYIVVGEMDYPDDYGIWAIKLDGSGNIIWQKAYNSPDWDFGYSIQQANDGGYIIAGETDDYYNWYDFWLIKTDANGNMDSSCNFVYDTNAIPVDTYAVTIDTNVIPGASYAIVEDTNIVPHNFDGIDAFLCQTSGVPVQISHKPLIDDSNGITPNGIIEANEAVDLIGAIENTGSIAATSVAGLLTTSSPIIITNSNAAYPDIAPGATANALVPYSVLAPSANRPALHWDINVTEHSSCTGCFPFNRSFIYHIGSSFGDVPATNLFYSYIEKLLHANITAGCTATNFCPSSKISREQMAKFVCASKYADPYKCSPTSCTGIFGDVSNNNIFCGYIEGLYNAGVINGCQASPLRYCPSNNVTREEMAKIICKTTSYQCLVSPGICQGIFADVPSSNPFCGYIENMYSNGIISGCQASPLLYCPSNLVTREQAAKYLVNAFGFAF